MTTTLPKTFVQLDDEPVEWSHFLYKASRGSSKAVDMVLRCEWALLSGVEQDYDVRRLELIPPVCPFRSRQDFLDHLTSRGHLFNRLISTGRPFHSEPEYYRNLWAAERTVEERHLLHDAVLKAFDSWSPAHYAALLKEIKTDPLNYDSLAAVIGGLYLLAAMAVRQ